MFGNFDYESTAARADERNNTRANDCGTSLFEAAMSSYLGSGSRTSRSAAESTSALSSLLAPALNDGTGWLNPTQSDSSYQPYSPYQSDSSYQPYSPYQSDSSYQPYSPYHRHSSYHRDSSLTPPFWKILLNELDPMSWLKPTPPPDDNPDDPPKKPPPQIPGMYFWSPEICLNILSRMLNR